MFKTFKRPICVTSCIRWWNRRVDWFSAVVVFYALGLALGEAQVDLSRLHRIFDYASFLILLYMVHIMVFSTVRRCLPTLVLTAMYAAVSVSHFLPGLSVDLYHIALSAFGIPSLILIFTLQKNHKACSTKPSHLSGVPETCVDCLVRVTKGYQIAGEPKCPHQPSTGVKHHG